MPKHWLWFGVSVLAGAAFARWQLARLFTEEPEYEVEDRFGPLEIRRYPPRVVAETTVRTRSWDDALQEGFRRLAAYIFGENRAAARNEKLAMTAPVAVRSQAPTEQAGVDADGTAAWTITFVMPKDRSRSSLPAPRDERVVLRSAPSRRVAVLRYAGRYSAERVAEKFGEVLRAVRNAGLRQRGEPQFAGYDPPWTLPLLRRNEVWVELG